MSLTDIKGIWPCFEHFACLAFVTLITAFVTIMPGDAHILFCPAIQRDYITGEDTLKAVVATLS